jgi:hypothetical protein
MRKLLGPVYLLAGMAVVGGMAACFADSTRVGVPTGDGGSQTDATNSQTDTGAHPPDGGASEAGGPNFTFVLIEDMETTTHGPIELDAGFSPPLSPGYWYNSGANYVTDGGDAGDSGDMSNPPQLSFVFSALPAPTTTLNGKASTHAARQFCVLNGLYDTCGVGFEFAQQPDPDAAAPMPSDAAAGDAGDGGPSVPKVTIPFDISRYKGIAFWGMTTTPDPTAGTLQVKVQLPDTDTDPRGEVCNGGGGNTSECYNSYAAFLNFTTSWQRFIVMLDSGDGGPAPEGGIAIDPTWGYQQAKWIPTQIYGINWQTQKNTDPGSGPPLTTEIWIDDVYFIE